MSTAEDTGEASDLDADTDSDADSDADAGDDPDGGIGCGTDRFNCGDGYCIPLSWVCDFVSDCPDGSDEAGGICDELK